MVLPNTDGLPDTGDLPPGIKIQQSSYSPSTNSHTCELSGDSTALAALGLLHADDPAAKANRVLFRLCFDRINEIARELGREDLVLVEPEIFDLIQQALAIGLGDPGPRPDVELEDESS